MARQIRFSRYIIKKFGACILPAIPTLTGQTSVEPFAMLPCLKATDDAGYVPIGVIRDPHFKQQCIFSAF